MTAAVVPEDAFDPADFNDKRVCFGGMMVVDDGVSNPSRLHYLTADNMRAALQHYGATVGPGGGKVRGGGCARRGARAGGVRSDGRACSGGGRTLRG